MTQPMNPNPEQNQQCEASMARALEQARRDGVTNPNIIRSMATIEAQTEGQTCNFTPAHVQAATRKAPRSGPG